MAAKKIPHFEKNMCSTAGANLPSGPIVPFQKRVNAVSHAPVNQIANNNGGVSKMQDFWHTAEILAHMARMLPECFSCRSNILIDSIYNLLTPHG